MAQIDMNNIAHSYMKQPKSESDYALNELSISWQDGGAYSLLGPSGCGKTTLLNILSGLLYPSQGKIWFDGKDVTDLKPKKRNIAQVFQFPVIYDTLTVFDNLAFPLRNRKLPESHVRKRVLEVGEMLDLKSELNNRASGLTADIKQIISLGRGLVREDVAVILLDEPLTVIDPHVKWILRRRLKQIHEQFKLTMIFVTHDQTEAMTFAEQVVLMKDGVILQQGTPEELFEKPEHTYVGFFIGDPGINLIPCKVDGQNAWVEDQPIPIPAALAGNVLKSPGKLKLGIRPAYCEISSQDVSGSFPAQVRGIDHLGDFRLVKARLANHDFVVKVPLGEKVSSDEKVWFHFPKERIQIFSNEKSVG